MINSSSTQCWLSRCQDNIKKFQEVRKSLPVEEQVKFIRDQYAVLSVLTKTVRGTARMQGVPR